MDKLEVIKSDLKKFRNIPGQFAVSIILDDLEWFIVEIERLRKDIKKGFHSSILKGGR